MSFLFMRNIYEYSFIVFMMLSAMLPEVLMEQEILSSENYFSNLKVFAIAAQSKAIQLKITWKLPDDKNNKYDVVLFSVKSNKSCSDTYCHEYDLVLENNYLSIPSHPISIIDHDWCKIQADCDYNITVKTLKPNLRINTMYHVPDCVENICSCHHSHLLPKTFFFVDSRGKDLIIRWSLDPIHELPEHVYLVDINISIIELNSTNADWGKYETTEEVKITLHNFYEMRTNGTYTKTMNTDLSGRKFSIRGRVIDSRGCHGKDGSKSIQFPTEKKLEKTNKLLEVLLFTFFGLLVSIIIVIILVLWKQRKSSLMQNWPRVTGSTHIGRAFTPTIEMVLNPGYGEISETKMSDPFEIPHHAIAIGREIGKGAFGRVFIAKLEENQLKIPFQIVAVKQLKKRPTTDQLEEFLGEIATLKKVGRHQNIVNLIGSCTARQPLMMIMEYVGCGDLLHYLRKVRAKHEAKYTRNNLNFSNISTGLVKQSGSANFASGHNNSNSGSTNNSGQNMKRSASNSSHIGLHGKYLEILHSHSSTSTTDSSSYITQPESLPNALGGANIVRNSFTETQYTNLSSNLEISVSAKLNALEYIVDHNELHNFAIQIARGMKHLEDKKITHRDLAARNILIDETKTLKISDFGLSRSGIYVNTRNKRVPLRWLSIEAMKDSLYSSKSDTWAYGIVLWEIGTLGGFPYPTVSNHELIGYLKRGERLECPDNCSAELYELMTQCWAERPEDRPTFKEIVDKLEPSKSKIYIDFDELGPAYVFPPTCEDIKTVSPKKKT